MSKRRAASSLLAAVALPYAAAVAAKNAAYDLHLLKPKRLCCPVISVGNLSVGGTGKTPLVLLLAKLLAEQGLQADVLTRGYGRRSRNIARVDPESGAPNPAELFGDEPLVLAQRGLAVFVGADRYGAGEAAEKSVAEQPDPSLGRVHILDDGFQHRRLARTVDIVLLQRTDFDDRQLPIGRLREPLRSLRRADICVLLAEDADLCERTLCTMGQDDPARVWLMERRTTLPGEFSFTAERAQCVSFCGLGNPDQFFAGLRKAGVCLAETITFRDHHWYTGADIARLKAVARNCHAQFFATTEKDIVRFTPELRDELTSELPLIVAALEVKLLDEPGAVSTLLRLMAR